MALLELVDLKQQQKSSSSSGSLPPPHPLPLWLLPFLLPDEFLFFSQFLKSMESLYSGISGGVIMPAGTESYDTGEQGCGGRFGVSGHPAEQLTGRTGHPPIATALPSHTRPFGCTKAVRRARGTPCWSLDASYTGLGLTFLAVELLEMVLAGHRLAPHLL